MRIHGALRWALAGLAIAAILSSGPIRAEDAPRPDAVADPAKRFDEVHDLLYRANAQIAAKQYPIIERLLERAERMAQRLPRGNPEMTSAMYLFGTVYYGLYRWDKSFEWLDAMLRENTGRDDDSHIVYGRFLRAELLQHHLNRPADAEREYRACLALLEKGEEDSRRELTGSVYGSMICLRVMYDEYFNPAEMADLTRRQAAWGQDERLAFHLPIMAALEGRKEEARACIDAYAKERLRGEPENDFAWRAGLPFAYACNYMGDIDDGLRWLDKGLAAYCAEQPPAAYLEYAAWLRGRNGLKALAADPRFEETFQRYDNRAKARTTAQTIAGAVRDIF